MIKLSLLESAFGHLSKETQEYLAAFPSEDGSMNVVEALERSRYLQCQ